MPDLGSQRDNVVRLGIVLAILQSVFDGIDPDERRQVMVTIGKWIRENTGSPPTGTASALGSAGTWKGD